MSSLFDYIRNNLSILDVVRDHVPLKSIGNYWKGSCPFHQETDASFTISPDKGIFYCFGCHAGGDLVGFIAQKEQLSQTEAAQYLIEHYSLAVPTELTSKLNASEERSSLMRVNSFFAEWTHEQLQKHQHALDYLASRQLSEEISKTFGIGYMPGGRMPLNQLIKAAQARGLLIKDFILAGIIVEHKGGLNSPFEERILFPIQDTTGRVCGFGGRIFRTGDERPKYYNSKESDLFSKGKQLFGINHAKKAMQEKRIAFLVEGYIDCLAMVSHGYANTVATLGTACTQEHLKILSRYASAVYVIYDGDQAGRNAMMRLTQLCWEVNLEPYVVTLPPREDPASYLAHHPNLEALLEKTQSIFSFFIETQGSQFANKSLSEKLAVAEKIIELLAKVNDDLKQSILIQEASRVLGIPFQALKEKLSSHKTFTRSNKSATISSDTSAVSTQLVEKPEKTGNKQQEITAVEEHVLALVLNSLGKEQQLTVEPQLVRYFSPRVKNILQQVTNLSAELAHQHHSPLSALLRHMELPDKEWLIRISIMHDYNNAEEIFKQLIAQFCKHNWKQIVQDLKARMQQASEHNNTALLHELFTLFSTLKQDIHNRGLI